MQLPSAIVDAKTLLCRDSDTGWYLRGSFVNYQMDFGIAVQRGQVLFPAAKHVAHAMRQIVYDLWNLSSLVARLEWTDGLGQQQALPIEAWRQFCSLDIEHFHTELRSVFDYAATCIAAASNQSRTVPRDSMNELLKWLRKKPGNRTRLGEDFADLLGDLPLFPDVKEIRDEMIHRGGFALVFDNPGTGLLFQVFKTKRFVPLIKPLAGVADGNVIDFRRYGSLLLAQLLLFLESLAVTLQGRFPVAHIGIGDARLTSIGWDTFSRWLASWDPQKAS